MTIKEIKPTLGYRLYDILLLAVEQAPAKFQFNSCEFQTVAGESLEQARQRFEQENGFKVFSRLEEQDELQRIVARRNTFQESPIS